VCVSERERGGGRKERRECERDGEFLSVKVRDRERRVEKMKFRKEVRAQR
jgi:hypothetical protein